MCQRQTLLTPVCGVCYRHNTFAIFVEVKIYLILKNFGIQAVFFLKCLVFRNDFHHCSTFFIAFIQMYYEVLKYEDVTNKNVN